MGMHALRPEHHMTPFLAWLYRATHRTHPSLVDRVGMWTR